jgi:Salmonella virulence plasmid 65kDa B protein
MLSVAAIALLSLAACGDDSSSKTASSTTTTAAASAALLPRNTVVPVSVVTQYFPEVNKEASTGPNETSVGKPIASRSVVFASADGGARFHDHTSAPSYVIHRYRPRIEGLFARIERWTKISTGEMHWRSISADNVTTLYGKDIIPESSIPRTRFQPIRLVSSQLAHLRELRR